MVAADCNSEPLGIFNWKGMKWNEIGTRLLWFIKKTTDSLSSSSAVGLGVELAGALGFDLSSMEKRYIGRVEHKKKQDVLTGFNINTNIKKINWKRNGQSLEV